ncbi:glycosyltransferase [Rhodopseudomonas palustris]|nr:glycosyltransferase [Rhodopseudomonas palustris]
MASRFLVVDQSLRNFEGHHHDYSTAIVRSALQMGLNVSVAAHGEFPGDALADAPVVGRFCNDGAASGRSRLTTMARRALAGLPRPFRTTLLSLAAQAARSAVLPSVTDPGFGRELLQMLVKQQFQPGDHVLIHTVGASEFLGLAKMLASHPPVTATLHVVLRYDGVAEERDAFRSLEGTGHLLRYWTDTEPLAAQYRELGCRAIGVLPIPHGLTALPPPRSTSRHPLTIGYLGGARGDKGFHLLPDLVDQLVGDGLVPGKARFLIQATFGLSREEGLMEAARCRLARHSRDCVALIETPPDSEGFQRALMATDLLLLPYDREVYQRRSSGLLVQAMALGIPTVVPNGTWLASAAPENAHVRLESRALLSEAVRLAIATIPSLRATALIAACDVCWTQTADNLLAMLLD